MTSSPPHKALGQIDVGDTFTAETTLTPLSTPHYTQMHKMQYKNVFLVEEKAAEKV